MGNVVTIDDLKTLQKLATTAKQSLDKEKHDRASVLDTQSIIAGNMGSGVTIRPKKPATSSLNTTGVSITPVDKTSTTTAGHSSSSTSSSSSSSQSNVDPNLTDDTFVVEAPSFIVPYVYEKPPKEEIKSFLEEIKKLKAELEEKEKKEKEDEIKKEKDKKNEELEKKKAEKKERREERQKRRDDGDEDVSDDSED